MGNYEEDQKVILTCALCRQQRLLRDSHIIPQGCYRRVRSPRASAPSGGSPVNIANGRAYQSDEELKTPLLCADCEKHLNNEGERYFLRNCIQTDETFPLYEAIQITSAPFVPLGQGTRYWRSVDLNVSHEQLAFFAASIFWRFAVAKDKFRPGTLTFSIPEELEIALRAYLTGASDTIHNSAISVNAIRRRPPHMADLRRTFVSPRELPVTGFDFSFKFYEVECLGFVFLLLYAEEPWVGFLRSNCILHHDDHPIFLADAIRDGTVSRLFNWARTSKPSKKLAVAIRTGS